MQFLVASLLSLLVFLLGDRGIQGFAGATGLFSVLFLGVFSTFLCYFLQTWAQRFVSSSKAGIIMGLEALFGALFSIMIGYDRPNMRMVFGGLFMLISIILPELSGGEKTGGSPGKSKLKTTKL
jgi:drug/metabolite transporter (DMT)-like permease